MAVGQQVTGDQIVTGTSIVGGLQCNARSITPEMMAKTQNQKDYIQKTGTAVVADSAGYEHIVRGATGIVVGIQAVITGVIATGADRTVTVDLHKSTGAGAFATILSATIGFTNVSVLRTVVSGTLSTTALVAGDILRIVVTVAGAAGNQAQGLTVTLTFQEAPV